ncbi:MAG: FAD-dependent oxidoreductase [Anaerolineae bacterium]|nr:FAD-dependent oxidoreductase [Anaerolineae bacterium]
MDKNVTVYGASWCPDCRRSKRFLSEQQIDYEWVDIEQNKEAQAYVEEINEGKRIIPTIVIDDDSVLVEPSNAELAEKLGLSITDPHDFHDVTIIGAGPAGLTAAIYAARDGFSVMVIDEGALGGQAATTEALENYPGFPDGISGDKWAQRVVKQAEKFGVEFLQAQAVVGLRSEGQKSLWITTGDGQEYGSRAILIATGADYRHLGVEGEDDFIGAGVHFCSTCDGPFYKDKEVAVVGSGYSAAEESLALLNFANKVDLLVRGDKLKVSQLLADKIERSDKIAVHYHSAVSKLAGKDGKLSEVHLKDKQSGDETVFQPDGLFVFIGQQPNTDFLKGSGVLLNNHGFIVTGHQLSHHPDWPSNADAPSGLLATSVPGVFAAGDVRAGSTKQVASASGEGTTAALLIREHLRSN